MNALQFLIDTIEKLINDPGQFENYQKELTTLYIDHADNQHVVSNAIELFFNHVSNLFCILFIITRKIFYNEIQFYIIYGDFSQCSQFSKM